MVLKTCDVRDDRIDVVCGTCITSRVALRQVAHRLVDALDVLDVFPIGINDSFFELGGDSLRLMQLMTQVERLFEVTISFADFFKQPTIANLSSQLSHKKRAANATEFMSVAQLHTEARLTIEPPSYSWSRPQQHWTKPQPGL